MAMSRTVDLGLDAHLGEGAAATLPLDEGRVRAVYGRHQLFVNGAVRALTLREPTGADDHAQVAERTAHWVDPRWRSAPVPRHTRLAAPVPEPAGPAYVQETLF